MYSCDLVILRIRRPYRTFPTRKITDSALNFFSLDLLRVRSFKDQAGGANTTAIRNRAALFTVNIESGRRDPTLQPPAWEAENLIPGSPAR
jgi:hypothetical protein